MVGNGGLGTEIISDAALLTVMPRTLTIGRQPVDLSVSWGQQGAFGIVATGEGPLHFRWQVRGGANAVWNDVVDDATYAGASTSTLVLRNAGFELDRRQFRCVLGDAAGGSVTSVPAVVRVLFGLPDMQTWPSDRGPGAGGIVSLGVTAPLDSAATFQWRRDGVAIPGATKAKLTISGLDEDDTGYYDIVVRRSTGDEATSDPALLKVQPACYGNRFTANPTFAPRFEGEGGVPAEISAIVPMSDGWVVAGTFTRVNGQVRGRIARIRRDGTLDNDFAAAGGFDNAVHTLARLPDGTIAVGGMFSSFAGQPRVRMAKLKADGTLDGGFRLVPALQGASGEVVNAILAQPHGGLLLGGNFADGAGARRWLRRVDRTGAIDPEFIPGDLFANATVKALGSEMASGRTLVVGNIRPAAMASIARGAFRLEQDGSLDPFFDAADFEGDAQAISFLPDGRVLLGGGFFPRNSTSLRGVVRLLPGGSADPSYAPAGGFDQNVAAILAQEDGRVVAGGYFRAINGLPRPPLLRLTATGAIDSTFGVAGMPPAAAGEAIRALEFTVGGGILVGGTWMQFGSVAGQGLVLLESVDQPPTLNAAPVSQTIQAGGRLSLSVAAAGEPSPIYQWQLDGVAIVGANASVYELSSVQQFHAGAYTALVQNSGGSVASTAAIVTVTEPSSSSARLLNLSTRAIALTGDNVLIPGFVIGGSGRKALLIRSVGPTLIDYGLQGVLPDPRLSLKRFNGAGYDDLAANDNWASSPNSAAIRAKAAELFAFPLGENSNDSALLVDLAPGQYSVVADDAGAQTGVAIVELYDADATTSTSRLINISNRGYVGTGESIMIPGFVVSAEGPKTVLIRAIGPTLATYGVSGVLADPTLSIYRSDELLLNNDDWSIGPGVQHTRDVAVQVNAFALPEGSQDAAFVVTLNPGIYTVHARGANGTTGVALVEVYAVP